MKKIDTDTENDDWTEEELTPPKADKAELQDGDAEEPDAEDDVPEKKIVVRRRKKADEPTDNAPKDTIQTIKDFTSDKSEGRPNLSLRRILGGDILTGSFMKKYLTLVIILFILAIVYITNRYQSQQELLEINALQEQLTDLKYDALSRSSELTEKCRTESYKGEPDPDERQFGARHTLRYRNR
jgi:preprotein translocase subunit SecF